MKRIHSHLPVSPGMGKHLSNKALLADLPKSLTRHVHVIRREEVEDCDFSLLTLTFGPKAPSQFLKSHCGRVIFSIEGYDDEPVELFEIDAVRRFLHHATHACPFWTFYASTATPFLRVVALAVCQDLTVIRTQGVIAVEVSQDRFQGFFDECLPAAAWFHHKAGIKPVAGVRHLKRVADYLGIDS